MRALPAPFLSSVTLVLCCLASMTHAQNLPASLSPAARSLGQTPDTLAKPGALATQERAWSLSELRAVPQWQANGPWDIDLGLPKATEQADQQPAGRELQVVSLNAYRRWSDSPSGVSPYLGAGIGIELSRSTNSLSESAEQGRPNRAAMQITAGASFELDENVSLFGQVQSGYAFRLGAPDISVGAPTGRLTNGINIGISLGF